VSLPAHLDIPADLAAALNQALEQVSLRFGEQLASDLPPVQRLVQHIEHYRGKMLRPTLVLTCGLAADPSSLPGPSSVASSLVTCAAVCEMIHMATLVHDDVLDEAATRRKGQTVNRLYGNEAAVILGDYLIAGAYHLCSQLQDQQIALLVGQVSMTLCSGELLQLSRREDLSLDEPTYFEIIERKTAALVALACQLGALCTGASPEVARGCERFGSRIGLAFQIQDDLLDLTGRQPVLGKPVGQDLAKGKLTLPMIHHLSTAKPLVRGRALVLLEQAGMGDPESQALLRRELDRSGSVAHAQAVARRLVGQAREELQALASSPAKDLLLSMADAVVSRSS
jgi:octaprenyl-diphosphate synthase